MAWLDGYEEKNNDFRLPSILEKERTDRLKRTGTTRRTEKPTDGTLKKSMFGDQKLLVAIQQEKRSLQKNIHAL